MAVSHFMQLLSELNLLKNYCWMSRGHVPPHLLQLATLVTTSSLTAHKTASLTHLTILQGTTTVVKLGVVNLWSGGMGFGCPLSVGLREKYGLSSIPAWSK